MIRYTSYTYLFGRIVSIFCSIVLLLTVPLYAYFTAKQNSAGLMIEICSLLFLLLFMVGLYFYALYYRTFVEINAEGVVFQNRKRQDLFTLPWKDVKAIEHITRPRPKESYIVFLTSWEQRSLLPPYTQFSSTVMEKHLAEKYIVKYGDRVEQLSNVIHHSMFAIVLDKSAAKYKEISDLWLQSRNPL